MKINKTAMVATVSILSTLAVEAIGLTIYYLYNDKKYYRKYYEQYYELLRENGELKRYKQAKEKELDERLWAMTMRAAQDAVEELRNTLDSSRQEPIKRNFGGTRTEGK